MEIVKYEKTKLDNYESVEEILEVAKVMIASKAIPSNFTKPEEVFVVIQKGRELGIGAVTALENIYYIQGKSTVSIGIMIALAHKAGLGFKTIKDFEPIKDDSGKIIDYETVIRVYRKHDVLGMVIENDVSFTYSEAKSMDLIGRDQWKKQLKNMTWIRCMSRAIRRYGADAVLNLYEVSEMADSYNKNYSIDEEGNATLID